MGIQGEHGLRDHAERALGADHPRSELVTRDARDGAVPEGDHVGIREDHLEAHPRLPGDDAVARVAGVLTEAFLTDPYTVSFLPRSRRRKRLGVP